MCIRDSLSIFVAKHEDNSETCSDTDEESEEISSSGLERSQIYTVGSKPKDSFNEWADSAGENPQIIRRSISPISNLFTEDYMSHLNINFREVKPWLERKLNTYCHLFQNDRNYCDHVFKFTICPSLLCKDKVKLPCEGSYSGSIDREFKPHGRGTYSYQDGSHVLSADWDHGCARRKYHMKG